MLLSSSMDRAFYTNTMLAMNYLFWLFKIKKLTPQNGFVH